MISVSFVIFGLRDVVARRSERVVLVVVLVGAAVHLHSIQLISKSPIVAFECETHLNFDGAL